MLTKEDILNARDIVKELVQVPEWGGEVYVKSLTGAERDQFEASVVEMRGSNQRFNMKNVRAKLAAIAICDEAGERLFSAEDVATLSQKSAAALDRVFGVASRLSGLSSEDVDNLRKNLGAEVEGDSTSA